MSTRISFIPSKDRDIPLFLPMYHSRFKPIVQLQESQQLAELRKQSKDGIIRFNETMYKQYIGIEERDYTLIVFLDVEALKDDHEFFLGELRKEYTLWAKAFYKGKVSADTFFIDVVYEESKGVFRTFAISSVPCIFKIGPEIVATQSSIALKASGMMLLEQLPTLPYPWYAEDMVSFFRARGVPHVDIYRPPYYLTQEFIMSALKYVVGALVTILLAVYTKNRVQKSGVLSSPAAIKLRSAVVKPWFWLHHPFIYCFGSLVIFWFSVGGGLHNIIRRISFFIYENGRVDPIKSL